MAIQLKLDELIRATKGAHNALMDLDDLDEAEVQVFRGRFSHLAGEARDALERGGNDTDTPDT